MPMMSGGALPTLSEIEAVDAQPLRDVATNVRAHTTFWRELFELQARALDRPDGTDWDGSSGERAAAQGVRDLGLVKDVSATADLVARDLDLGADWVHGAKQGALAAVEAARDDGLTVNEDLSVTCPAGASDAMKAAAVAHAADIREAAERLAFAGDEVAAGLTAASGGITITFPPLWGGAAAPPAAPTSGSGIQTVSYGFPPPLSPANTGTGAQGSGGTQREPNTGSGTQGSGSDSGGTQREPNTGSGSDSAATHHEPNTGSSADDSAPDSAATHHEPNTGSGTQGSGSDSAVAHHEPNTDSAAPPSVPSSPGGGVPPVSSMPFMPPSPMSSSGGMPSAPSAPGAGGLSAPSSVPPVSPAVSPAAFTQAPAASVDPGVRATPLASSVSPAPIAPVAGGPLPVTAATGGPPPAAAAVPPPVAGPAVEAAVGGSAPAGGGGGVGAMPPPMLGGVPPPMATPLSSGGVPAAAAAGGGAAPALPPVGGGSATASVVPVTAAEQARKNVARMTRQLIGDVAGESRRLAAALIASSRKRYPTLQWCVGGCEDDGTGPLMVVASNLGLGFLPAATELPRHTAVHVFADSAQVEWERKARWVSDPVAAVLGFGQATGRPVTVIAGLAETVGDVQARDVAVQIVTPDSIPSLGVMGGRNRLEVVDAAGHEEIKSLGMTALAELLPDSAVGVEPDGKRAATLFSEADIARDVDDPRHQLVAWQAFCADQAAVSAYRVTHPRSDSGATADEQARTAMADYRFYRWNLVQIEAALAAIPDSTAA